MKVKIDVTSGSHGASGEYYVEMAEKFKAEHGIDMANELAAVLIEEVKKLDANFPQSYTET